MFGCARGETIEKLIQKRKRDRSRSKKTKSKNIERMVVNPLVVGRRTRMNIKVDECLEKCNDKINELMKEKKEIERQLFEKKQAIDDVIETEQQKTAEIVAVSSLRMVANQACKHFQTEAEACGSKRCTSTTQKVQPQNSYTIHHEDTPAPCT